MGDASLLLPLFCVVRLLTSVRHFLSPPLALCNEDANGNVPLGKSCNRYWQCQGGYPRLQRCPAMLVFDRRSLRCVVPPTEDCDIPTTQAPAEGDGQQQQQQGALDDEHVPAVQPKGTFNRNHQKN